MFHAGKFLRLNREVCCIVLRDHSKCVPPDGLFLRSREKVRKSTCPAPRCRSADTSPQCPPARASRTWRYNFDNGIRRLASLSLFFAQVDTDRWRTSQCIDQGGVSSDFPQPPFHVLGRLRVDANDQFHHTDAAGACSFFTLDL